jgi:hypothetical protein
LQRNMTSVNFFTEIIAEIVERRGPFDRRL